MKTRIISISLGGFLAFLFLFALLSFQSFGESRHTLSIVGITAIALAAATYFIRKHFLRWGRITLWLRFHQGLAICGVTLALIHAAFQLRSISATFNFSFLILSLVTGLILSFLRTKIRRPMLGLHLMLASILGISVLVHGSLKLRHDSFFPLTDEHSVPCVACHEDAPTYETHFCTGCHVHNTQRIKDDHIIHGVYDYKPCLDCHAIIIYGKKYGKARVPGVAGTLNEDLQPVY
ncbi:MAG: hypothetical protein ACE5PV_03735 [Candidatus Poribacteria bacterium]